MHYYLNRVEKLRRMMNQKNIFGVYITSPENVFYLSGFTGFGDGTLFITNKNLFLITDSRYILQAKIQCPDYKVISDYCENVEAIKDVIINEDINNIGFENNRISYKLYKSLKEKYDSVILTEMDNFLTEIRDIKDEDEIAFIKKACDIACKSLKEILPEIKPGVSEKDIAAELEYRMKKNGAQERSFDTIVASGIRSAMPHGVASEKKIDYGDVVTIDFGCKYQNYCSDMTRTFFVGKMNAEIEKIYDVVYDAHISAIESYKPGMTGKDLHMAAVNVMHKSGCDKFFTHSLGHGVGLEIHEGAAIGIRNILPIKNSTIFSIEPGIYIENLGGVRIEDLVLMKNGRLTILTEDFDKKKLVL